MGWGGAGLSKVDGEGRCHFSLFTLKQDAFVLAFAFTLKIIEHVVCDGGCVDVCVKGGIGGEERREGHGYIYKKKHSSL